MLAKERLPRARLPKRVAGGVLRSMHGSYCLKALRQNFPRHGVPLFAFFAEERYVFYRYEEHSPVFEAHHA